MRKPFKLFVDSGGDDEPSPRRFATLEAALEALDEYDDGWKRFAWIIENHDEGFQSTVHVSDGKHHA